MSWLVQLWSSTRFQRKDPELWLQQISRRLAYFIQLKPFVWNTVQKNYCLWKNGWSSLLNGGSTERKPPTYLPCWSRVQVSTSIAPAPLLLSRTFDWKNLEKRKYCFGQRVRWWVSKWQALANKFQCSHIFSIRLSHCKLSFFNRKAFFRPTSWCTCLHYEEISTSTLSPMSRKQQTLSDWRVYERDV